MFHAPLLALAYCVCALGSQAGFEKTTLHIGLAVAQSGQAQNPGRGASLVYPIALEHLNEDLPPNATYRFSGMPVCDTQSDVLRGFDCAMNLTDFAGAWGFRPIGIVGAINSAVTLQMVPLTTRFKMLQCSGASSSAELSDRIAYPYFFRTVAPADKKAEAILKLFKEFSWKRAILVHTTDAYATSTTSSITGKSDSIVFTIVTLHTNIGQLPPAELAAKKADFLLRSRESRTRVVLPVMMLGDCLLVLSWAGEHGLIGPGWVWIGQEAFGSLDQQNVLADVDSGTLGFSRASLTGSILVFHKTDETNTTARVRQSYIQRYNKTSLEPFLQSNYDCFIALGRAVAALLMSNRSLSPRDLPRMSVDSGIQDQLAREAVNQVFEGASGQVEFNQFGDRVAAFSIKQWANGGWEKRGTFSNGGLLFERPLIFSNNQTTLRDSASCVAGQEMDVNKSVEANADVCRPCSTGRFKKEEGSETCKECEPGFYCEEGAQRMELCVPGTVSSAGSGNCTPCPAGKYGAQAGRSCCSNCSSGFFQDEEGRTQCTACAMGSFQPSIGASGCTLCPQPQSTDAPGMSDEAACGCAKGGRWVVDMKTCKACPQGLLCPGFNATPLVEPGYYMGEDSPRDQDFLDLFKCDIPAWCPGQSNPGDPVCASGREGLNCGRCKLGLFERGNGCSPCNSVRKVALPLTMAVVLLCCGVLHYFWNHGSSDQVNFSLTTGTTVAMAQKLGIVSTMGIEWPQFAKAVLEACGVLLFDLSVLAPSCLIPTRLLTAYLARVTAPIFLVACFLFWWACSRPLHRWSGGRVPRSALPETVNSIGMVLSAVYISTAISSLSLVDCYQNPNQKRTIRSFPFALCSGPDFEATIPLFVIAVLVYVIGLVVATCYALWMAPATFRDNKKFRAMVRFMVYKFRPSKYWFGVVIMLGSFVISLVTVVVPDSTFLQIFGVQCVSVLSLTMHLVHVPYKRAYANLLENAELTVLICFLNLAFYFHFTNSCRSCDSREYADWAAWVAIALVALMLGGIVIALMWNMYFIIFPGMSMGILERELEESIPIIFRGCSKVMASPELFRLLLRQETSYVERHRVTDVMRFFDKALTEQSSVRHGRLFTTLRSGGGSASSHEIPATGGDEPSLEVSDWETPVVEKCNCPSSLTPTRTSSGISGEGGPVMTTL